MPVLRANTQPAISNPKGPKDFIAWNSLEPESRKLIMLTVEDARGTAFKARSRYKIQYGQWEELGKSLQEVLYGTNWRRILKPN
jgi:hypothetical protein